MKATQPLKDAMLEVSRPISILRKETVTVVDPEPDESTPLSAISSSSAEGEKTVNLNSGQTLQALQLYRPPVIHLRNEEEEALEVLREVVRKCTSPDALKKPTATEVLEMLNGYM